MILVVALAFAAASVASLWAAPGWPGVAGSGLAALMLAVAVSDWRRYRVPDRLNLLAFALRGFDILVSPYSSRAEVALELLMRAFVAFALFFAFRALYGFARGREGLGLGDVKLAGVAGAWVGWRLLPWVVEAAALVGLALAMARLRGRRAAPYATMRLPFAAGFAPAIWLGWWFERAGF